MNSSHLIYLSTQAIWMSRGGSALREGGSARKMISLAMIILYEILVYTGLMQLGWSGRGAERTVADQLGLLAARWPTEVRYCRWHVPIARQDRRGFVRVTACVLSTSNKHARVAKAVFFSVKPWVAAGFQHGKRNTKTSYTTEPNVRLQQEGTRSLL